MEYILAVVYSMFGSAFASRMEQWLRIEPRFRVNTPQKTEKTYRGQPIYGVEIKPLCRDQVDIQVTDIGDASGDGVTFFPATTEIYSGPNVLGIFATPNADEPRDGAMNFEEFQTSTETFTVYFAVEKSQPITYLDIRFTILDESQKERRRVLKLRLKP